MNLRHWFFIFISFLSFCNMKKWKMVGVNIIIQTFEKLNLWSCVLVFSEFEFPWSIHTEEILDHTLHPLFSLILSNLLLEKVTTYKWLYTHSSFKIRERFGFKKKKHNMHFWTRSLFLEMVPPLPLHWVYIQYVG